MEQRDAVVGRVVMAGPAGEATIVFDPMHVSQADSSLFEPWAYGTRVQPVAGRGGRGAAWFVEGSFGSAVLRHYRRGGWMARVSRGRFVWRGADATRSLREYALLTRLHGLGLPVPRPLAAQARRSGATYDAALLMARIDGADAFAARVNTQGASAPWEAAGAAIAACHRAGARHADLNANNLLVDAAAGVWLIDWDKGTIEPAPGAWCARVLDRLARSLRKECKDVGDGLLEAGMARLRVAHDVALSGPADAVHA